MRGPDASILSAVPAVISRWRRLYGGLKVGQARRLKDLERENQRLEESSLGADAG
jgi:Transposase